MASVPNLDDDVRYTDAPLRREEILQRLASTGYVASQHLATELGVSEMTIRRDLQRLEAGGLVHRVAGGAVLPDGLLVAEPFDERTTHGTRDKRTIARATMRLPTVAAATSFALDAGTTVVEVAPHLPPGIVVATHSVPILAACAERTDLHLIGLGGAYQPATRSFAGPATRAAIEDLAVDVVLLSAVAIGPGGLYCTNPLDAETKQLLSGAARYVVVLADHSKFTASAPLRFAPLDTVDVLVTDAGIDAELLVMLRAAVPQVVVANSSENSA